MIIERIPKKTDEIISAVRKKSFEIFWLLIIMLLMVGLMLLHARMGGFDTKPGSLAGMLFLVLLLSPLIDWMIDVGYKAARTPWFGTTKSMAKIGRLWVAMIGLIVLFFGTIIGTNAGGLPEILYSFLKVLF